MTPIGTTRPESLHQRLAIACLFCGLDFVWLQMPAQAEPAWLKIHRHWHAANDDGQAGAA